MLVVKKGAICTLFYCLNLLKIIEIAGSSNALSKLLWL